MQSSRPSNRIFSAISVMLSHTLFVITLCHSATADDNLELLIRNAWKERTERIRTADITLQVSHNMDSGYLTRILKRFRVRDDIASAEQRYTADEHILLGDHGQVRLTYDGLRLHLGLGLVNHHIETAFDGTETKSFMRISHEGEKPQGHLTNGNNSGYDSLRGYTPLHWWFGSFVKSSEEGDGFDFTPVVHPNNDSDAQNLTAIETERPHLRIWLDREREYLPTRIALLDQQLRPYSQIEVSYVDNPECGWAPSDWTVVSLGEENKRNVVQYRVTALRVNQDLAASAFDVSFPDGILFVDQRGSREQQYTLGNGGEKLPLLTAATNQEAEKSTRRKSLLFLATVIATAILSVLVAVRSLRRRSPH